jgi:hypothetical protein
MELIYRMLGPSGATLWYIPEKLGRKCKQFSRRQAKDVIIWIVETVVR